MKIKITPDSPDKKSFIISRVTERFGDMFYEYTLLSDKYQKMLHDHNPVIKKFDELIAGGMSEQDAHDKLAEEIRENEAKVHGILKEYKERLEEMMEYIFKINDMEYDRDWWLDKVDRTAKLNFLTIIHSIAKIDKKVTIEGTVVEPVK